MSEDIEAVFDNGCPPLTDNWLEELKRHTVSAHYLPGKVYKVARQTLENNRGVLCTPAEYRQIQALSKTAQAQKTQRDIEEMRAYQVQISNEKQPVAAKTREEELRRAAADHATKYEQQRAEAQQAICLATERLPHWVTTSSRPPIRRGASGVKYSSPSDVTGATMLMRNRPVRARSGDPGPPAVGQVLRAKAGECYESCGRPAAADSSRCAVCGPAARDRAAARERQRDYQNALLARLGC